VGSGTRLLDVACGPGYIAAAAAKLGAHATGVDFAPTMVEVARRRFPGVRFEQGDAEALAAPACAFDSVTCGFGIGHFADPDRAIAEAARVLAPGGRYAFSWWCSNEKHEYFGLVYDTIRAHGKLDVPLPPAPPFARFSEPQECERALAAAGFVDVRVREEALSLEAPSPQFVLDLIYKSGVRTAMLLALQTPEARARIEQELCAGALRFQRGGVLRFAFPALVASGSKPG
jgi:SAM-dependent methyltransferase